MAQLADNLPGPIVLGREPDFRIGSVDVRPSARQVTGKGRNETLEPRVMQVLVALVRADGAIVTQDELIERCWNGVVVGDNAIHRVISRIRHVAADIADDAFQIETIAKVGYRLKSGSAGEPIARLDPAPSPPVQIAEAPARPLRLRRPALAAAPFFLLVTPILHSDQTQSRTIAPASLAVLPFRTLSDGQDFFAEGVAEEILGQLAREPELEVAGRTSTRLFAAKAADTKEVGRKLGVAYVLEGSVRKADNRVRVNVALVRTSDGMQHWSKTYAGTLDDIFLIQGRIGGDVASSLKKKLVHIVAASGPMASSGAVYSDYLSARKLMQARESTKATQAIEILRTVVKRDPGFAPAWASLGQAIAIQMSVAPSKQRDRYHAEAVAHVRRALALQRDLVEAHTAMAIIQGIDLPEAERHIRRAAELAPSDPEVQLYLAHAHLVAGDFQKALGSFRRSAELDPLFRAASGGLTWYVPRLGQDEVALRQIARLEQAGSPSAMHIRGHFTWAQGKYAQALGNFLKAQQAVPFPNRDRVDQHLGELLRELGYPDRALRMTQFDDGLWRLWQGEVPTIAALRARNRTCLPLGLCGGEGNDHDGYYGVLATKLLLNAGRGRELAQLYDSGEGLIGLSPQHLADRPGILTSNGPLLVLAMRAAGQTGKADAVLGLIDRNLREIAARGPVPNWFHADCAQAWALQGRKQVALAALERALDQQVDLCR